MNVVVIGAGIYGVATSYYLTRQGASVTLVDRQRPGAGTSGATFAWLNAFRKQPRHYHALSVQGIHAHAQLARELGTSAWHHPTGGLQWAAVEDSDGWRQLDQHRERLQAWNYPCEVVDAAYVTRTLEPSLALPAGLEKVIYTPEEGWIEVLPLLATLLAAAREQGLEVRFPAEVTALEPGDAPQVRFADGGTMRADAVVIATGPSAASLTDAVGYHLPLEERPGMLAISRPAAQQLRHVIHAPGVHFRSDAGGRLLAGRKDQDHTYAPPSHAEALEVGAALLREIDPWLPSFRGTPLESVRVGLRPIPGDGLPVAGQIADGVYLLVSHGAITLGPLLGRLAAEEVMSLAQHEDLTPYRPDRFETARPVDQQEVNQ